MLYVCAFWLHIPANVIHHYKTVPLNDTLQLYMRTHSAYIAKNTCTLYVVRDEISNFVIALISYRLICKYFHLTVALLIKSEMFIQIVANFF